MDKKFPACALNLFFLIAAAYSQLTIEECHFKAEENYPLARQYGLIEQSAAFTLSNTWKSYLPQFAFSAKGSNQSDVTSLPFSFPGAAVPEIEKQQYLSSVEISQVVWDGGVIQSRKNIVTASGELEKRKTAAELYTLRERVNQVFFGILLLDEKLKQNLILQNELGRHHDLIAAYIRSGIASRSDSDIVKVEQLNAAQRMIELESLKSSYLEILGALTGTVISERTYLVRPDILLPDTGTVTDSGNRPEMRLFEAGAALSDSRRSAVYSGLTPKINLFLQGGYGRPALNMFDNDFSFFYIGGVRLLWNLNGFYTLKNDLELIEIEKKSIETDRDTFIFNNNLQIAQQKNEIDKAEKLLVNDDEIILLRNRVKKSAEDRVENGTLSISDLIKEINASDSAFQEKAVHEIQQLMAVYKLRNLTNN
jgi:outer membrane protein TolC